MGNGYGAMRMLCMSISMYETRMNVRCIVAFAFTVEEMSIWNLTSTFLLLVSHILFYVHASLCTNVHYR